MSSGLRVAVVGLGKIGATLAAQYARKGASVTGCDVDAAVVEAVNRGEAPVSEPGLAEALAAAHDGGVLSATLDTTAAVRACNVVVVIVPVGIDAERHADYASLDAAADAIGPGLERGDLVILESTVAVGATRNRFGGRLGAASGLSAADFRLAYSPERVSSGTIFRDLGAYPKLVGGVDAASGAAAAAFYRRVLDAPVMELPDAETAEFAKLAEAIYRDVNIALANELARAAELLGIDYAQASQAANSQPYSHLHAPGLGVGGHCVPVYPYFLIEASGGVLAAQARAVNDAMAAFAADKLERALAEAGRPLAGSRVLVLGLAYRGGVKEASFSSTLLLAEALRRRRAAVLVHDPLFTDAEMRARGLEPSTLPPQLPVDAVVLQAAHAAYAALDLATLKGCRIFLDGRGAFDRARVEAAGLRYLAIGLGR